MKLPTGLKTAQLLNKTSPKNESIVKALLLFFWYLFISLGETLMLLSISSWF